MADKFFDYKGKGRLFILENHLPYRREVVRYLELVTSTRTGQTLVKYLTNTAKWTLIQPFKPTEENPVNAAAGPQSYMDSLAKGEPFVLWSADLPIVGKITVPGVGTGAGSNSWVWYHPANQREFVKRQGYIPPGAGPGEVLFHELVHAMRKLHGLASYQKVDVNPHMHNNEEFCAVMASNIYRSERGFKLIRSSHAGFKPEKGALTHPAVYYEHYKDEIDRWFTAQRGFCLELAQCDAAFNPLRVAAIERGLMPAVSMRL